MGTDKALVEIDGHPFVRRVADALDAAGATTVTAVGGDCTAFRSLGLTCLPDRWPGAGPLGGVITALQGAGSAPTAVVLSCDLLRPDPAVIGRLASWCDRSQADLVVPTAHGREQWTHGAWRRDVVDRLVTEFARGERSLAGAAAGLQVERIAVLDPSVLRDVDRPSDLPRVPDDAYDRHVAVPEIDIETLATELAGGAPVFDVRQPDEYREARVPGVRLVPLHEVPERVEEFPRDETVYVVCRSGGRSGKAVEFLRANGVDAVNVAGGTLAWIEAEHPVDTGA